MRVVVILIVVGTLEIGQQDITEGAGKMENQWENQDQPNHIIIEIG